MPKRSFSTIEEFRNNLHQDGATLAEVERKKVPCILLSPRVYEELLSKIQGKVFRAETLLDIFYDGMDVFVDVQINFRDSRTSESLYEANYLYYANDMLEFFEALAETGLLALAPSTGSYTGLPMIQLPQLDAARKALQIIKSNAKRAPGRV